MASFFRRAASRASELLSRVTVRVRVCVWRVGCARCAVNAWLATHASYPAQGGAGSSEDDDEVREGFSVKREGAPGPGAPPGELALVALRGHVFLAPQSRWRRLARRSSSSPCPCSAAWRRAPCRRVLVAHALQRPSHVLLCLASLLRRSRWSGSRSCCVWTRRGMWPTSSCWRRHRQSPRRHCDPFPLKPSRASQPGCASWAAGLSARTKQPLDDSTRALITQAVLRHPSRTVRLRALAVGPYSPPATIAVTVTATRPPRSSFVSVYQGA